VTVPVTLTLDPGAALLVFLTAFAEFGAPMVIGEGYQVLPTIVYSLFVNEMGSKSGMASTAATLLVLCTTGSFWLVLGGGRRRLQRHEPVAADPADSPAADRPMALRRFCLSGGRLSLIPAIVVAVTSFFESRGPVLYPNFSLWELPGGLFNVPRAIANSFLLSSLSTVLDVPPGTLIAYLVVRRRSATTAALDSCVMVRSHPGDGHRLWPSRGFQQAPLVLTGTFMILLLAYLHSPPAVLRCGPAAPAHSAPDRPGGGGGVNQLGVCPR